MDFSEKHIEALVQAVLKEMNTQPSAKAPAKASG